MKPYIFPAWEKEAKTNDKARAIRKKAMDVANAYWVTQGKPNYGVNGNMALECLRTVPETQKDGPVGRFFYRFAPAYQRGTFVREWNNLYRKTLYARPSETAMAEASQKPEYQRKPGQDEPLAHYPEIDKARRGREMAATLKPFFDWLEAIDYTLARMNEDGEARPIKLGMPGLTDLCWQYLGFDVTKLISEMDSLVARIGTREGEQ